MPRPPRLWLLKLSIVIRLIYPSLVMAIITFSFGIKSSIEISKASNPIEVLLSSPYFSAIKVISSFMTPKSSFLSARIAFNSLIFSISSLNSFSSFSRSKPVRALRRISTIAWDCTSLSPNLSIKPSLAICVVFDARIMRITSSILSRAISNPCNICALSSALFSSYWVLRVTTSS